MECAVSPPYFEHLTKCPKLECAVSPPLILKHLVSSVVSLAQLVSSSVALPAELVYNYKHSGGIKTKIKKMGKIHYFLGSLPKFSVF